MTVPLCSHALSLILSSAPRQCPCAHMPYPSFYHLHHDSAPVLTCPIPHFIICTMTVPLSSHALSLILSSAPRQCPCAHMPYPSFYHLHHDSAPVLICPIPHFIICTMTVPLCSHPSFYHLHHDSAPVLTCPIPHFIICTTTVSLCSHALSLILSSAPLQCPCAHMPLSLILSSAPRQCPCAHMPYPSFYHLHHDSAPVLTSLILSSAP